nr:hypothetical protein [Tanacetum cinerariifolium]
MNPIAAQQVALDNALVAPEKRLKIEKCNARIKFNKPQRETTYQVTLDALKLSPCYLAFLITAEVPEVQWKYTGLDRLRPSRAQILWEMSNQKNVNYVALLWEDFMFQADNRDISLVRKEDMLYSRFTKVIINHFISMRNRINLHTVLNDTLLGTLKFVSKTKDYQKYRALIPEEMINQAIKDFKAYKTYLDFATGKATPKKARNGDDDDSNDDDRNDDVSDDEDVIESNDDHEEADDERTKSDEEEEEAQFYEYVHTLEDYAHTEDETNDESKEFDEEEYKELYGDVNISLKDTEPADKEKGNQVKDDAQATQKTEGPILSSSISSDYAAKYLNFNNFPSVDTEVVSMLDINVQHEVPRTSPLFTIPVSVIPEHTVVNPSEIVTIALSITISSLLSEVLNAIKEYLQTSLDDALYKVLKKHDVDIIKNHVVPAEIIERLRQQYVPEKSTKDFRNIKMEHARNSKQKAMYHALMESILEDQDAKDEGVADKLKKRKQDDVDKDKGPFVGSDRGLKRRKTRKNTKPSKKAKSTETSKGTSKSQPKSTVKYAQIKETVFKAKDTQELQNQGQYVGNINDQSNVKATPKHDWFKKLERPLTLDSDWNVRKSIDFRLPQTWIIKIAQAKKPHLSFDKLMSTPINFSAYVMNHLKIDKLTQEHIIRPTFNLLKGT